ncbi:urease accessory protein UreD [Lysinibacillus xylanilyticus]|uniref:Urease accessory protein UreD n=1 Tax=Lysinibacillus xylanilyticus TaxID=582475 RepID=A0ABT4EVM7_9BACI|nr:urease accessory protein UreD [Lysinibacillus xylanilyticus]MCY9549735.1 urease accessory protein UreD [Lysinibacillus xylanilyticus]MED3804884.1 urease accessory protein UreD [Lysinibacillus xylanilyticus]
MSSQGKVNHYGKLEMAFELRRGYTRLVHVYQQPPLKASRELYEGNNPTATVFIMESSGGMVAGDRNEINVKLAADSQVRLKQQSALKIYPSHTGERCTQSIMVELQEQARLEWMPEVTIPFERAKFQVDTTIRMKESATLMWGEIIAPGREMRGEIFDYQAFRSIYKLYVEDELIAFDTLLFKPQEMDLSSMGLLEKALYIGSLWIVSPQVKNLNIRELQDMILQERSLEASVTRLTDHAIHCRWLSKEQRILHKEVNRMFVHVASLI